MTKRDLNRICLKATASVHECIQLIEQNRQGIALIIDEDGRLIGTVTDGDIRRYILAGRALSEPTSEVMWTRPLTVTMDTPRTQIRELMHENMVRNIPILDTECRPVDLVNISDFVNGHDDEQIAFIMAGGEGKRLRPITETIPKPLIKVGNKPILGNIITGFREAGIMNIYIAVNYKSDIIEEYVKNNFNHGLKLTCLKEKKKLGTAGALSLLPHTPTKPFIVINGDIITRANFGRLLDFHNEHRCVMTVAATQYMLEVPYGVLDLTGHYLMDVKEKPTEKFLCNAGIYVINPEVLSLVPKDTEFDMPDLIRTLVQKGLPITTFPIHEYWIDVGQLQQLNKARNDMENNENVTRVLAA